MDFFKQNQELTIPWDRTLTDENSFLKKEMEESALPIYEEVKGKLPSPIWEGHEDVLRCYWKAWQIAFGNLRQPIAGRHLLFDRMGMWYG